MLPSERRGIQLLVINQQMDHDAEALTRYLEELRATAPPELAGSMGSIDELLKENSAFRARLRQSFKELARTLLGNRARHEDTNVD